MAQKGSPFLCCSDSAQDLLSSQLGNCSEGIFLQNLNKNFPLWKLLGRQPHRLPQSLPSLEGCLLHPSVWGEGAEVELERTISQGGHGGVCRLRLQTICFGCSGIGSIVRATLFYGLPPLPFELRKALPVEAFWYFNSKSLQNPMVFMRRVFALC